MKNYHQENLKHIISPQSIAVIGASTRQESVGRALFSNILFSGYTGIVYPVNPKARGILGVRAYRSVWDIPGEVDLAVVIVPGPHVPTVIEECGEKGVKGAIIITAGFKEMGKKGAELEQTVVDIAEKHSISLIGPNCLGVINTDPQSSLNSTFVSGMPRHGNIAFISQSGALGVASLEYARENNIGLSKFFSVGNKADVTENNLLAFLKDDPQTDVILLYLEDLTDPKGFVELAREMTDDPKNSKPILAIKSGRTQEGARAASSHTGALGSSDEAYNSLFAQCGVMRVETIEELFDYAMAFATLPLPRGNRVGIVSNAGGFGILATDASVRHGLELATFEEKTTAALKKGLPPAANINNPVDIIGDAKEERYVLALENVLADDNVDCAIVITTPPPMIPLIEITEAVSEVIHNHNKPVVVCIMGVTDISESVKLLDQKNIPHYLFPEAAARSMASIAAYSRWLRRPRSDVRHFKNVDRKKVQQIILKAKKEGRRFLPEPESNEVLKAYGFPVLESRLAKDEKECIQYAEQMGYPVVLKIVSPDILHKVDVGGVKINLNTANQVQSAYKEILEKVTKKMPNAKIWGIFVQKMASNGKETIIGMNRDPLFGPMLMFGLGGVYVEILKDVTFRIAPIRELGAVNMVNNIRGHKLLQGIRGEKPSDTNAIAECLMRLSQLAMEMEEIVELDINPLMVFPDGEGVACEIHELL